MSFHLIAGGALIGAVLLYVIDSNSQALNNKEKWEQDLNDQ